MGSVPELCGQQGHKELFGMVSLCVEAAAESSAPLLQDGCEAALLF